MLSTMEDFPPAFGKSNKTPRTPTKNSKTQTEPKSDGYQLALGKITASKRRAGQKIQHGHETLSNKIDIIQQSANDTNHEILEIGKLWDDKIKELETKVDEVVCELKAVTKENKYRRSQLQKKAMPYYKLKSTFMITT